MGHSMTKPSLMLSPSSILLPPSSRTFIPAKEIGSRLKSVQFERENWKYAHSLTIIFGSRCQYRIDFNVVQA
jgi:hypothetical protein